MFMNSPPSLLHSIPSPHQVLASLNLNGSDNNLSQGTFKSFNEPVFGS